MKFISNILKNGLASIYQVVISTFLFTPVAETDYLLTIYARYLLVLHFCSF